jgi:phospholipase/lecithinase/hemolysin
MRRRSRAISYSTTTAGVDNVHESWFPYDLPGLQDQIGQFVSSVGGVADPDALHVVWAGPNNIFALESFDPVVVQNAITQAMGEIATAVSSPQQVGAEHIVVANMPDLSLTP